MEDRDWLILQVLYEQKNITKTAHILFLSQPALTARLRQIEEEFGAKIVYRCSKGVHFTTQGEYLAKSAGEMLLKIRTIKEHVSNMEKEVTGTLRLGASNFFTKYKLPPLLKLFRNQYPQVEFKVTTGWSKDVFNSLYNQDIHVGFIRGDYSWQGEKYLLSEESMCIASIDKIDINDLPHLPMIDYQTDSSIKPLIDNWWRDTFSEPPSIIMSVNQLDTCKEMVVNGLGYAIIPRIILNDMENLHIIDLTDKNGNPIIRRTWMIYHHELLEMNIIKVFVDFIKTLDFHKFV